MKVVNHEVKQTYKVLRIFLFFFKYPNFASDSVFKENSEILFYLSVLWNNPAKNSNKN